MAEAKKTPKMEQIVAEDGTLTFKFNAPEGQPAIGEQVYKLSDFPENVRDFFAVFGMRTKLRNFTTPDQGESEATVEKMAEKLAKGANLLKEGLLRVAREPGERKAGGTLLLEAAIIFKKKKAAAKGEEFTLSDADVARELEGLSEEQLEQLKNTTLFKLAMVEAKEARMAAKKAELEKKAAEEAAAE